MYKVIIFDFDGTILDSRAEVIRCTQEMLAEMGLPPRTEAEIKSYVGHSFRYLVEMSVGTVDSATIEKAVAVFRRFYMEGRPSALYSGTRELLNFIAESGRRSALYTNKPKGLTLKLLKDLDLTTNFCDVQAPEDGTKLKPDVTFTHELLERLAITPQEAIMVGDSEVDFEAAKNVGMSCILVRHGFAKKENLELLSSQCLAICDDIEGVTSALQQALQ